MKHFKLNKTATAIFVASSLAVTPLISTSVHSAPWETGQGLTYEKVDASKNTFNTYRSDASKPKVSAYLSNWTHFQQGYEPSIEALSKYDTVILSFFGLCGTEIGDPSITSSVIALENECDANGGKKFELMTTDSFADLRKAFPSAGIDGDWDGKWMSDDDGGLFGVMKKLAAETDTKIAISIFGWSLSNIASDAVKPENRHILIDSLIEFVTAYPFVSQLDIDWEYPGILGAPENVFDPENDARNYGEFVAELKQALVAKGRDDVRIGIASGAPQDKIDAAELKSLVDSGVDTIHLMTYDFFGETWAEQLTHHTNLMKNENSDWSSDTSIQYMINELGVNPQNIQIGYANYSRNATKAEIESHSPLKGNFTRGNGIVVGTFEGAVTAINDVFTNYTRADETGLNPINGYKLFTDAQANADYLYRDEGGIFKTLDTPRTVYAKSQYVQKHNLGGIFTWMADQDEGLMLNAAREGLGYEVETSVINMENIINTCGDNITPEECAELTHIYDDGASLPSVEAGGNVEVEWEEGKQYSLSGAVTNASEIEATKWSVWQIQGEGVTHSDIVIDDSSSLETYFSIAAEQPIEHSLEIVFKLSAQLADGKVVQDFMTYTVKPISEPVNVSIESIDFPSEYYIAEGNDLSLTANIKNPDNSYVEFDWETNEGVKFVDNSSNPADIDLSSLVNKPEYDVEFSIAVSDGESVLATATDTLRVIGDPNSNEPPKAAIELQTENPVVGTAVLLGSASTDELEEELSQNWEVTLNGSPVVSRFDGSDYSFMPQEAGEYEVSLTVTDVFDETSTDTLLVAVKEKPSTEADYIYPDGFGNYQDGTTVEFVGDGIYQCFGAWSANCNDEAFLPGIAADPSWVDLQWKKIK
ncbi:chitinase [Vibrio sp. SCSIO 43135]|uniref:glycoside hydrolase family 18 protein n=1 Tax=Vibrio sp. SCSIO 43135 TaxID=2819096 RepID=UPI0020756F90|nr:glycosyl hydrolase family 18 protein [Vibrio sp. SCSIO 43135]USD40084.1 chitinase [Vibrio sp. SCSIO 43135]